MADTHGCHDRLDVPDGDILIHAGDLTASGSLEEVSEFADFLSGLPHRHKVVIAGNHDWCFEETPDEARRRLGNVTYLQDEAISLCGFEIYGSPWQPWFMSWAFNLERGEEIAAKWRQIPETVDILITHGPPADILDVTVNGDAVGCEDLLHRIRQVRPILHVFGHIHEARGVHEGDTTLHVNASTHGPREAPFVITI